MEEKRGRYQKESAIENHFRVSTECVLLSIVSYRNVSRPKLAMRCDFQASLESYQNLKNICDFHVKTLCVLNLIYHLRSSPSGTCFAFLFSCHVRFRRMLVWDTVVQLNYFIILQAKSAEHTGYSDVITWRRRPSFTCSYAEVINHLFTTWFFAHSKQSLGFVFHITWVTSYLSLSGFLLQTVKLFVTSLNRL